MKFFTRRSVETGGRATQKSARGDQEAGEERRKRGWEPLWRFLWERQGRAGLAS